DDDDATDDDSVTPPPCGPVIEPLVEGRVISDADLATLVDGSVAIVWTEYDDFSARVVAMVCPADGSDVHGPVDVGEGEAEPVNASDAVAAAMPGGGFVVAYFAEKISDSSRSVQARWFDAFAQPASDVVPVREGGVDPSVAVNPATGSALIAWVEEQEFEFGLELEIVGRLYDSSGAPETGAFSVSHDGIWNEWAPKIAAADDEFVVTWYGDPLPETGKGVRNHSRYRDLPPDPTAIWAAVVDGTGYTQVGPSELDIGYGAYPDITSLGADYVFAWKDSSVAYAGLYSAQLTPLWNDARVLDDSFESNGPSRVVALDPDAFLAVWSTLSHDPPDDDESHTLEAAVWSRDGGPLSEFHVAGDSDTILGVSFEVTPFDVDGALVAARTFDEVSETHQLTLIHCVWDDEPGCNPEL
ncbi:MAG: hypothetical protein IT350_19280, partial [Deltaproteobacteria bacterium]|nr:hypothetical protein [Deltaproteobacteria bacterium]